MTVTKIKYKDWEFEVDRELTRQTYDNVALSGADSCICNDLSRPEIGLHKNVNLWKLEFMKTKRA
jgi:hypothetical protein